MNTLPKIVLKELRRLEPVKTAAFFAGLTLLPELLSNNYRLELLIHSALVEGRNKSKQISKPTAKKIFSAISGTSSAMQEDPAEDVMVSLVKYNKSCFLLLEGLNESNGFHTQRFLTIVERLDTEVYSSVKKSIEAILLISNEIIKKAGLSRYQEGGSFPVQELEYELISDIERINSFVKFDEKELQKIGVDISDIQPFIYWQIQPRSA